MFVCTVPIFNSCTKCAGGQGIIKDLTLDSKQFPGYGCKDDLTTERNFDSQASWVINMVGLFSFPFINGCLYNQALTDVQSTGAGNRGSITSGWKEQESCTSE